MTSDILPTIEFNAGPESRHDTLTKAILGEAAAAIRKARLEHDSYRRELAIERSMNRTITVEAKALESALAICLQHEEPTL